MHNFQTRASVKTDDLRAWHMHTVKQKQDTERKRGRQGFIAKSWRFGREWPQYWSRGRGGVSRAQSGLNTASQVKRAVHHLSLMKELV